MKIKFLSRNNSRYLSSVMKNKSSGLWNIGFSMLAWSEILFKVVLFSKEASLDSHPLSIVRRWLTPVIRGSASVTSFPLWRLLKGVGRIQPLLTPHWIPRLSWGVPPGWGRTPGRGLTLESDGGFSPSPARPACTPWRKLIQATLVFCI